jgi:hypothetical protein
MWFLFCFPSIQFLLSNQVVIFCFNPFDLEKGRIFNMAYMVLSDLAFHTSIALSFSLSLSLSLWSNYIDHLCSLKYFYTFASRTLHTLDPWYMWVYGSKEITIEEKS